MTKRSGSQRRARTVQIALRMTEAERATMMMAVPPGKPVATWLRELIVNAAGPHVDRVERETPGGGYTLDKPKPDAQAAEMLADPVAYFTKLRAEFDRAMADFCPACSRRYGPEITCHPTLAGGWICNQSSDAAAHDARSLIAERDAALAEVTRYKKGLQYLLNVLQADPTDTA